MNAGLPVFLSISDIAESTGFGEQMRRFWTMSDPAVRTAVAGTILLGLTCGMLGCFVVLRRMSLLGDSLGHAVLPGVCAGFLVTQTKHIGWIFTGAVLSALLAAGVISLIHGRTRLKADAAMGLVLSGFYGLGVVMLTRLQRLPLGNQSGLNRFLFGQASAISAQELAIMAALAGLVFIVVLLTYKELAATCFDLEFATASGIPTRAIHYLLMLLVAIAIVISIQAVGIVLLSAMLIIPAATAHLLTDRLKVMIVLSMVFGAVSGVAGANLSFLKSSLPTGPFIVAVLLLFFVLAFLFSPRYGLFTRLYGRRVQRRQSLADRIIKALAESRSGTELTAADLAATLQVSQTEATAAINMLRHDELIEVAGTGFRLTPGGVEYADALRRNERLWKAFLEREGELAGQLFDPDTDDIERVLGAEMIRELEGGT